MLSQISPNANQSETQELLTLVTQLAHYLKILIRIALTGSLKLEREQGNKHRGAHPAPESRSRLGDDDRPKESLDLLTRSPQGFTPSTQVIAYGYRSLAVGF
jgi:hypothetical protein